MVPGRADGIRRGLLRVPALAALLLVRAYQLVLSPFLGGACRFVPSCSEYAGEALQTWGFLQGTRLTVRRVLRCQPFSAGGYDPVPAPDASTSTAPVSTTGRRPQDVMF